MKMARRRKTEAKAAEKSSIKYVPVRKSSRQIARKQLEEKKINGNISQTSCSNSPEEIQTSVEDQNQAPLKKNQNSVRKHSRHKSNKISAPNESDTHSAPLPGKKDTGESDSQDGIDQPIDQPENLSPQAVQQVVIGNSNTKPLTESASINIEEWQEDVIEETIICEEMEVEQEVGNSDYPIAQGSSIVVEEVLVMDEPNAEEKTLMEFTVIQNEDGTESMVLESNTTDSPSTKYTVLEEKVGNEQTIESENSVSDVPRSSSRRNCNNAISNLGKSYTNKKRTAGDPKHSQTISDKQNVKKESHRQQLLKKPELCPIKEDSCSSSDSSREDYKQSCNDIENSKQLPSESSQNDTFSKIDNKMAEMQISESSKEIQKLVNDLSNMEGTDSPVQLSVNVEKILPMSIDDESSSSILDKMEQLHRSNNTVPSPDTTESFKGTIDETLFLKDKDESSGKKVTCDNNVECVEQNLPKGKSQFEKRSVYQRKNLNSQQGSNEISGIVENDSKVEGDDTKFSSSSDNSNDTLLSTINDIKCSSASLNDVDKKVECKTEIGNTDATSSDSGSNSSGVRRSSRIRSIGLMKQRSRGRGLVTKPNTEALSKSVLQQERDKLSNTANQAIQEIKLETLPDVQSDKENNLNKTTMSADSITPLAINNSTTGYESDSSKPVKVKSRWRRSSELEMGGSNTFGPVTMGGPPGGFGPLCSTSLDPGSNLGLKSISNSGITEAVSSDSVVGSSIISANTQISAEIEQTKELPIAMNNCLSNCQATQIPKAIGAKILLPMVESKDRDMEERLSQFEYLRENLYLTERYTNRETKKMVCDCFLTEDEIDRGELGCGEDCLNRLLMIECGPKCVLGDRCTNKRFQNCDYAKCEVFRTEKKGFGLRATVDLLAGDFIMEYVGEVVDPKDFRRRAKEYSKDKNRHYYFMALKSDQIIDATMKGNISRFINHSCDPNAETQKWTVNGELRIGFFNKKYIAAGEEITFDYHFQRYGKEAQRCYCEAINCRGWIGETPEEEQEKIETKEKREKDTPKKKEEKKPADHMEDEDLEEEIDKLCAGGLKNRAHTLTLSRLMVRSREIEHRTRLLRFIQSGEQPCRRLFLDYHGLRLIWSYVMDVSADDSEEAQQFRLEVLKTLNTLPVPNKTMLMDSKIYDVVEKWSKHLYFSPNADSPDDEQVKPSTNEESQSNYDANEKKNFDSTNSIEKRDSNMEISSIDEIKTENTDQTLIPELASSLLAEWSNLKEVFRIPKKERIEQMKEHEREADRGYREELEKEEQRGTSYDRHRSDRFGRLESDKRGDRRRGRESPESEHSRTKDKRTEERSSLVPIPRMTKHERRQLFALKVAKEDEERQRRQQQESWQEHENRCLALGIDPHTTAMVDPQTGYPVFYNPSLGQWQHYPTQGGPQPVPSLSQTGMVPPSPHILPPALSSDITSTINPGVPTGVPPVVYSLSQTTVFNQTTTTAYSMMPPHRHQQYSEGQLPLSNNMLPIHSATPPAQMQPPTLYNHVDKPADQQFPGTESIRQSEPPPIDLPPKWKSAIDARGRIYYYHVKDRISQWLPPPPDHIGVQPDSSSTEESSDESTSSNEDDEEVEEEQPEEQKTEESEVSSILAEGSVNGAKQPAAKKVVAYSAPLPSAVFPEPKKRRDGLVQERIISPRREEDRVDHKSYKGIKEKLRRQKERAKLKEHVEKLRKHRRSNKSKSHSRHSIGKLQSASTDMSTVSERKIKDMFRINMANVMVHFLNPYRKNDCKQGRITNTEDFKHLARKLTHFVLAKELKHCKSVDELQCNENVKHKAKDFVRKYMSKFGAVYQKSTDED